MSDFKTCPQCAEEIRAQAIKCRFCGNTDFSARDVEVAVVVPVSLAEDLEPIEEPPSAESLGDASPVLAPAPSPVVTASPERSAPAGGLLRLSVWLVVLVALGVGGWAWFEARQAKLADEARDTLRATISPQIEALFTYTAETFDDDVEQAQRPLTPGFRREYREIVDDLRESVRAQSLTQRAQVVAVSVVEAEPNEAELFLYVNTTTINAKTEKQSVRMSRMTASVIKRDGRWLIEDLNFPTN